MTPQPLHILYIGRDAQVAAALQRTLASRDDMAAILETDDGVRSLEVAQVTSQKGALDHLRTHSPSLILVETDFRQESRVRFCLTLRHRLPLIAILAVGKRVPEGNDFTFDGFIQLPLVSAAADIVAATLHRFSQPVLQVGALNLNLSTRLVRGPAGEARLTPKQCQLLQLLMKRAGEVVRRQEIMLAIWDTAYLGDTRTLDVHIRWLREQIEPNPSNPIYLETVRGVGYRLNRDAGRV